MRISKSKWQTKPVRHNERKRSWPKVASWPFPFPIPHSSFPCLPLGNYAKWSRPVATCGMRFEINVLDACLILMDTACGMWQVAVCTGPARQTWPQHGHKLLAISLAMRQRGVCATCAVYWKTCLNLLDVPQSTPHSPSSPPYSLTHMTGQSIYAKNAPQMPINNSLENELRRSREMKEGHLKRNFSFI